MYLDYIEKYAPSPPPRNVSISYSLKYSLKEWKNIPRIEVYIRRISKLCTTCSVAIHIDS